MHDFSWYPRQKYVYQGREVIKVEADVHSYFMGTVYNYRVTCFDGRVKRGEAQRNDFSGFLNSHNMLPAWAEEKKRSRRIGRALGIHKGGVAGMPKAVD